MSDRALWRDIDAVAEVARFFVEEWTDVDGNREAIIERARPALERLDARRSGQVAPPTSPTPPAESNLAAFRDDVLHGRGPLAENGMTSEQVNDVLRLFDSHFPGAPSVPETVDPALKPPHIRADLWVLTFAGLLDRYRVAVLKDQPPRGTRHTNCEMNDCYEALIARASRSSASLAGLTESTHGEVLELLEHLAALTATAAANEQDAEMRRARLADSAMLDWLVERFRMFRPAATPPAQEDGQRARG